MVYFDYVPVFFYEGVEAVENLYLIEFQNEVDKIVKEYLFNISSLKNHNYFRHEDNENSRKKYYENKGFGLIAEESENTYVINEERFLEGCTRVFLINPIIKMLLDKHGIVNDWKFGNTFANFNVSNREYELGNYLEFIALLNGKRIGVRYTKASYSLEELTVMDRDSAFLFGKNKIPGFEILESIDEVCVLDWSGVKDEELNEIHPDVLGTKPFKKNISVQKFFLDYFSEEEYKVVLMVAKRAVKQAKDIIALRSVPQLLPNNILYFKQSIIEEFAEERMDSLEYQFRECDIAFGLDEEDMQIIKTAFFTLRYRDALIGDSDFAKSFITSEYLFKTVRDGLSIDYTSVVVGYLKSVEQLLFLLYLCAFGNSKKLAYWDKCNRTKEFDISNSEKYRYDPYDESCMQEKYMHRKKTGKNAPVIKDLTRFLRYYEKMNNISENGKEYIFKCLEDFRQYCRNSHFHKDNIDSSEYDTVKRIRNNAHLCLYYVLGAFRILNSSSVEKQLGIIDYRFELLYQEIHQKRRRLYKAEFPDGLECLIYYLNDDESLVFNTSGLMDNTKLRFMKTNMTESAAYSNEILSLAEDDNYVRENTIIITRNSMPVDIKAVRLKKKSSNDPIS